MKALIFYIVDKYWEKLQNLKYTQIFDQIKAKYDQNQLDKVKILELFRAWKFEGWEFGS